MLEKFRETEEGFTLIEMMITSFIILLLLSFPVLSFKSVQEKLEVQLFMEELASGMTLMQNQAILTEELTQVEVTPSLGEIRFLVRGNRHHELNHSLFVPSSVTIPGSGVRRINYSRGSGNINDFAPLHFDTPHGRYTVSFSIGSGRFEIKIPNE